MAASSLNIKINEEIYKNVGYNGNEFEALNALEFAPIVSKILEYI